MAVKGFFYRRRKTEIKAGIKAGLEGLAGQILGLLFIQVHTEGLPSSNADLMLIPALQMQSFPERLFCTSAHVAVVTVRAPEREMHGL